MKKCGICKVVLPLGDFSKWTLGVDGLKAYCKNCIAAKRRAERIEKGLKVHKIAPSVASGDMFCVLCERVMMVSQFRSVDVKRDTKKGWCKECTNSHQSDKAHARGSKLRRRRDPHLLELGLKECFNCNKNLPFSDFSPDARGIAGLTPYCKPCLSLRASRDKPYRAASVRNWRKNNPNTYRAQRITHAQKRRATKLGLDSGLVTSAFMKSIYEQILCVYCGRDVPRKERTADHVVPLNKGGLHHPSNLVMCCGSCNSSKGATDLAVFLERIKTRGL